MNLSSQRRNLCAVFFILLVLSVYWLIIGKVQICMVRMITGFPCPGCGLTHAVVAMLNGQWKESLVCHPLMIPTIFIFIAVLFRRRISLFEKLLSSRWFFPIVITVFFTLYIIRMILYYPDGPYPMVYDHASIFGFLAKTMFPLFH